MTPRRQTPSRTTRISLIAGAMLAALTLFMTATAAQAALTDAQRLLILEEAQTAFDEGVRLIRLEPTAAKTSFRLAADRYRQLLDDGVASSALHYNLANACVRAGDLGEAILHYRIAQQLAPGDDRIAHNLASARSLRRTRIDAAGETALRSALLGWHERTSLRAKAAIFFTAWLVFWLLLLLKPVLRRRSGALLWIALLAALAWLPFGASLAVDVLNLDGAEQGVLLRDDVIVRMGNGEGFEPQFEQPLHQGVEFDIIERRGDWLHIRLPDGKDGWIPSDTSGAVTLTHVNTSGGAA